MANEDTLDDFFAVLGDPPGSGNYKNVNYLMSDVFCPDGGVKPNQVPWVGITDHGPNFQTASDVELLFNRLFTSFPDLTLTRLEGAPLLSSDDDSTLGIQTTLKGSYSDSWFPNGSSHYSRPLSRIPVSNPNKAATIPAFAVFTFDDDELLSHLAIYLDRYRFITYLGPETVADIYAELSNLTRLVSRPDNR
jgi:hypothetical protein